MYVVPSNVFLKAIHHHCFAFPLKCYGHVRLCQNDKMTDLVYILIFSSTEIV